MSWLDQVAKAAAGIAHTTFKSNYKPIDYRASWEANTGIDMQVKTLSELEHEDLLENGDCIFLFAENLGARGPEYYQHCNVAHVVQIHEVLDVDYLVENGVWTDHISKEKRRKQVKYIECSVTPLPSCPFAGNMFHRPFEHYMESHLRGEDKVDFHEDIKDDRSGESEVFGYLRHGVQIHEDISETIGFFDEAWLVKLNSEARDVLMEKFEEYEDFVEKERTSGHIYNIFSAVSSVFQGWPILHHIFSMNEKLREVGEMKYFCSGFVADMMNKIEMLGIDPGEFFHHNKCTPKEFLKFNIWDTKVYQIDYHGNIKEGGESYPVDGGEFCYLEASEWNQHTDELMKWQHVEE